MYNKGVIDKKTALDYATSASDMELRMSGIKDGSVGSDMGNKSQNEQSINVDDEDIFDLKS
jgi:twitching motility protein PilT